MRASSDLSGKTKINLNETRWVKTVYWPSKRSGYSIIVVRERVGSQHSERVPAGGMKNGEIVATDGEIVTR